jgi:hypothetical protein
MTLQEAHYFLFTKSHIEFEQEKQAYEVARFQSYLNLSPYLDKKKCNTIKKLFPFPWEEGQTNTPIIQFSEEVFEGFDGLFKAAKDKKNTNVYLSEEKQ